MVSGNPDIRRIRDAYLARDGRPIPRSTEYRSLDIRLARRIAMAYEVMPPWPLNARTLAATTCAHEALVTEVDSQFAAIVASGYQVTFTVADPYPNSAAMMADLRLRRCLQVLKTAPDQAHPFLTAGQNDRFRAVHDIFGHAMEGYQFGPRGEDNAWREHARMFSAAAIPALTTETRGQNCWVNFLPGHEHLEPRCRPYARQKFGLLPVWAYREAVTSSLS